ncbi:BOLA4, chloroplastic/mitochondrial-like protein [Drosera capensis]
MALLVRPYVMYVTRMPLLLGQTRWLSSRLSPHFDRTLCKTRTRVISSSHRSVVHLGCGPVKLEYHVLGRGHSYRGMSMEAGGNVNSEGSVDSSLMSSMQKKIKEQLDAELVNVEDAYGDGRHVSIYVVSSAFEGQSAVNRQRMVYKAIWEELQETVHAVDRMITVTPSEASKEK